MLMNLFAKDMEFRSKLDSLIRRGMTWIGDYSAQEDVSTASMAVSSSDYELILLIF
jgi:hypothetical protein